MSTVVLTNEQAELLARSQRTFKYSNVKKVDKAKSYIDYTITYDDSSKSERRKEYGKYNYKISLTKNPELGDTLLGLVLYHLQQGIDPQISRDLEDLKNYIKLQQEQKEIDDRVSIDDAIQKLKHAKGWDNPIETKEQSAEKIPRFLKNQFKPYLIKIGKDDDIRQVTRTDIKNLIEAHFNPRPDSGYDEWSSSTCTIYKQWISILFSMLVDKDIITINPTQGVKVKNDSEKINISDDEDDLDRFTPWKDQEITLWYENLKGGDIRQRLMYATSHVLHYAFLRKTEILRLRVWMIDLDDRSFKIPSKITKSAKRYGKSRILTVDMPDALVIALSDWIAYKFPNGWGDDDYLFPSHKGNDIECVYSTFNTRFQTYKKKLRKKYAGLFLNTNEYAMKHMGVIKLFTTLSKKNKPLHEIKTMVASHCRHSSFDTTEIYLRGLHLVNDDNRERINF